jgi:hypothetical protein
MQTRYYEVEKNSFGYLLTNATKEEKFVLYESKNGRGAPYYLKKVAPTELYVSGMFLDSKNMLFKGRTVQGIVVTVRIEHTSAIMRIKV